MSASSDVLVGSFAAENRSVFRAHLTRRYVFTFIDPRSRVAFAGASTTRSNRRSAHALRLLCELVPKPINYILSDNGSEFMKDFETELKQRRTTHWWTYPKSPKMNAHVEPSTAPCRNHSRTTAQLLCEKLLFIDMAPALTGNWRNGWCFTTPNAPIIHWGCNPRYNRS